jgi:hypothetical protein
MNREIINRVEVLATGELLLGLEGQGKPMHQYVYREAAGVYWDENRNGFKSIPMKEWSCSEWYKHIVKAVHGELGVILALGSNVTWLNIPDKEKKEIQSSRPGGTL